MEVKNFRMTNTQTRGESSFYSTPTRRGVFRKLKTGETRVSDIAENLTVGKGAVHYQLQNIVEEGAAVQIQDEYMLKKDAVRKKRRMQQKMQDFKEKLERMLAYRPNMGRFWKRYQKFQEQKQRFESMGVECPSFGPEHIVRSKKNTVQNVLKRTDRGSSSRKHRKFEQIQEFELICSFVESKMGFDLDPGVKKISLENPIGVKRLESALA